MALVAADLKEVIQTVTYGQTQATAVLPALGNAIANYIMASAEVFFSWGGIDPVGPPPSKPDPVTTATGKISELVITLTPSMATTQAAAYSHLKQEFVTGLSAAKYNITDSGFSTSPMLMDTSPLINNLTFAVSGPYRDSALLQLATNIVQWVTSQMPTGVIEGSHGTYLAPSGAGGLVTSIT